MAWFKAYWLYYLAVAGLVGSILLPRLLIKNEKNAAAVSALLITVMVAI